RELERELRARIAANPGLQAQYGGAWDAIAAAQRELGTFAPQLRFQGYGGASELLALAGGLVRVGLEGAKPDAARLPAYRGAGLSTATAALLENSPIDTAYERLAIAAQLRAA